MSQRRESVCVRGRSRIAILVRLFLEESAEIYVGDGCN